MRQNKVGDIKQYDARFTRQSRKTQPGNVEAQPSEFINVNRNVNTKVNNM